MTLDFSNAFPFQEAVTDLLGKNVLPTNLGSAELRQLDQALKRQSLFSARTTLTSYLDEVKSTVESLINPKQVLRAGETQTVTEGFNPATARATLRDKLKALGYSATPGEEGTIKDLASDARLDLVIKTNTELAQGAGRMIQMNDPAVLDGFPAQELVRYDQKDEPRDWKTRWRTAAAVANDPGAAAALELQGRMVALKSSGIWQALGDGAGGFDDTLGNPFPPFAFNSGMWVESVSREDAMDLGLIKSGARPQPAAIDFANIFGTPERDSDLVTIQEGVATRGELIPRRQTDSDSDLVTIQEGFSPRGELIPRRRA